MEKQNEMLPENEEQISNESNTAQNETITQSVAEEYSFDMLVDMAEECYGGRSEICGLSYRRRVCKRSK